MPSRLNAKSHAASWAMGYQAGMGLNMQKGPGCSSCQEGKERHTLRKRGHCWRMSQGSSLELCRSFGSPGLVPHAPQLCSLVSNRLCARPASSECLSVCNRRQAWAVQHAVYPHRTMEPHKWCVAIRANLTAFRVLGKLHTRAFVISRTAT